MNISYRNKYEVIQIFENFSTRFVTILLNDVSSLKYNPENCSRSNHATKL